MYSDLESNESKRREVVSSLYWSLMQGWNIPLSIQEYYGLTEDYRLFHQLEGMAPDEYLRKRQTGEVPDILEVDARLTHAVEKIFESVCPAEKAYRELDARFVRMTGRRPYADEFFRNIRPARTVSSETTLRRKPHINVRPKPKGRKMGL